MSTDKDEATRLADALRRCAPVDFDGDFAAVAALLERWPDAGEPVAFALRFAHDKRLNLSTVFDTPEEAQDYVRRCATSIEVVPLYAAPPAEAERIAALEAALEQARVALEDMNNGWKYIRRAHGDLYGVGWDRAEGKADAALRAIDEVRK